MDPFNIVFMGTAGLSCPSLQALVDSPTFSISGVVTQPDRPKGRELKLHPSPVKELAARLGLSVLQPEKARNEEFISRLREFAPDLIVVVAYGQILPKSLLELPRFGCINVHTSLLPKYRGAAPIQWAMINGESETGVTIMKMDAGLDTGDILSQEKTFIADSDTSESLHDRLAITGAGLLIRTLPAYLAGKIVSLPQLSQDATYASKIRKEDGQVDWTRPAITVWNRWRGLLPWPGAFTRWAQDAQHHLLKLWQLAPAVGNGQPGEILQASKDGILVACGDGAVLISALQREGGKRLSAQQFLAGHSLQPGQILG